ncbi:MAG: radical SAM protein [Acidobacteriota bacterium]|nr:radical SAM protein [Acidobacteriota bacterium]
MTNVPDPLPGNRAAALERARRRMGPLFRDNQVLGRRNSIGCVALEITQRCNLDCTLCYLSENSERVKDIPLPEVYRRIDRIFEQFGAPTAVQITGGDPTLRKREELVAIVRYTRERGLLPTLMTNGIKATRDLLEELAQAGLNDVAFHVDVTQERKGYTTETDLNPIREEYIERARGIPIAVIFNTTVCRENFDEIPEMIRFFRRHADVVGMASFQLQADTGRGVLRERDREISLETVREQIGEGAGIPISWDTVLIGHPACHRIGITLEANGNLYDLNDDPAFFNRFLSDFQHVMLDRREPRRAVSALLSEARRQPGIVRQALRFALPKVWKMRRDLLAARGRVHKLSFFVQNFMDASALDPDRIHACSFMVMTAQGPVSMCAHNAKRDEFILKPLAVRTDAGQGIWNPLSGVTLPVVPADSREGSPGA